MLCRLPEMLPNFHFFFFFYSTSLFFRFLRLQNCVCYKSRRRFLDMICWIVFCNSVWGSICWLVEICLLCTIPRRHYLWIANTEYTVCQLCGGEMSIAMLAVIACWTVRHEMTAVGGATVWIMIAEVMTRIYCMVQSVSSKGSRCFQPWP